MPREVILLNANLTEVKVVDERMNRHPEFLQETMFAEQGTKVLITNPAADKYLDAASKNRKEKFSQWEESSEDE